MQIVILCGGKGTRIRDVSEDVIPKPMVPVGERPIVWHIMKYYAAYGHSDFILCLGYQGWKIKEYFLNYRAMAVDLTVEVGKSDVLYHDTHPEEGWAVTLAETGLETCTAGRVRRIARYLGDDDFMLTYGDGLSNVNLDALAEFHAGHGRLLTVTGVVPPGRFGELSIEGDRVRQMREKPVASGRYINGGFMVCRREFVDRYLASVDDSVMLEREPFEEAAGDGEMMIYRHDDFWQCMDNYRDWELLNRLWAEGRAPWKVSR
jgi:glucose-1-phosphate cytidylyltransferase